MRVIEVDAEERSDRWLLWLLAGTAIGVTAGVLVAERYSGRRPSTKGLLRRLRSLAKLAGAQWAPMVDVALELKEMWEERRAGRPSAGHAASEEHDDFEDDVDALDLEDEDEYEEASPPFADLEDDAEDEEDEEEDDDNDDGADDEEEDDDSELGARVLEAFVNDPVLAERPVEIEADDDAGEILLFGQVRSPREVSHAVTIARGVPGVRRVRQRLSVRGRR
ncbi:MAG: BON domain-containing protein [Gemmatimonadaceae bacterium]|nr:BON domain-containing protein [Gemmatimonadaceae bacterium]MCW5827399.1 BON domain-containing protein [Gemmatimonadaceae bacterium]